MNKNIKNIKFTEVDSSLQGTREFVVTYECDGKPFKDFIFVGEQKGLKDSDYLKLAKKKFKPDPKLIKNGLQSSPLSLKVITICSSVAAVVLAILFTWKMLANNSCTITWDLGNGETVKENYHLGEMPSYKGEIPSKPDDTEYDEYRIKYHYTFNGWQEELMPVTKNTTYHIDYLKESLYFVVKINMLQSIIDNPTYKGTYTFDEPLDAEEASQWEVDWGDGDIEIDQHSFFHQYTTPGIKYIKVHSPCKSLYFANADPEAWAVTGAVIRRVTLPYGWTTIDPPEESGTYPMFNSVDLETIDIPSTMIRVQCLSDTIETVDPAEVSYLNIPNSVTTLDKNAFTGFAFRSKIVIPDSVTTVKEKAFYDCKLPIVSFPNTITNYPSQSLAFADLSYAVVDFTAYNVPPTIAEDTFQFTSNNSIWFVKVRPDTYNAFLEAWSPIIGEQNAKDILNIY